MGVKSYSSAAVSYFDQDGKVNLRQVLNFLGRARKRRPELRTLKLVFMTGFGEGPLLATRMFREDKPTIIAVAFPPLTKTVDGLTHAIPEEVAAYLRAMKVEIVSARLPFDGMDGSTLCDHEMRVIKGVLSKFGRSVPLCVQAVLQACDHGLVSEGEDVIGITGDLAAVITASSTASFLGDKSPFYIREFICKAGKKGDGIARVGKANKLLLPPLIG